MRAVGQGTLVFVQQLAGGAGVDQICLSWQEPMKTSINLIASYLGQQTAFIRIVSRTTRTRLLLRRPDHFHHRQATGMRICLHSA